MIIGLIDIIVIMGVKNGVINDYIVINFYILIIFRILCKNGLFAKMENEKLLKMYPFHLKQKNIVVTFKK